MMKKIVIGIILYLALVVSAKAQNDARVGPYLTLSEAKEIANTYYGAFQQMAKHPVGDVKVQSEFRLLDALGKDDNGNQISSGFRVPNDLVEVVESSMTDEETVLITNYIGNFLQIAEEKNIDFSYKQLSNEYVHSPEMRKSNDTPPFVRVVVQKTIKPSHFSTTQITDTMFLNTRNKSVSLITNQYRGHTINYDNMSREELFAEAQNMYSNKRYEEAYKLYQKVLEKGPKHVGASYSLGVMSFKGEGCKQYPRKVRDYLAEFYWQKSAKGINELMTIQLSPNVIIPSYCGLETNPFPCNRLLAVKNDKYGYISAQGKMVIKQQYLYGYPFFSNGTTIVKTDKEEWFLIDTIGTVKDQYDRVIEIYTNNPLLIETNASDQLIVKRGNQEGVINRITGAWDIPLLEAIKDYYNIFGHVGYVAKKGGKWGVLSPDNSEIIPFDHNNIAIISAHIYGFYGIKVLCDYDEAAYDRLWKKYQDSAKIPEHELERIGTLEKIEFK